MASIKWSTDALVDLDKIDSIIRRRILLKISWLGENFSYVIPEKLHGQLSSLYKLRVGDYRVVYTVQPVEDVVRSYAIGHRREVYKGF